jgi:RHS repeat-associated protein
VCKSQYQTDNDSRLQLLGHRYYDASVGRFISSDPAQSGDNWYAYCDNNPLAAVDPSGLDLTYRGFPSGSEKAFGPPITRIRTQGGSVGTKIGHQIDKPDPRAFTGKHIRIEPLDPNPAERTPNQPAWWPHSRYDSEDPSTWVIYIDPKNRPTYTDPKGKVKQVPLESLVTHEFGHLLLLLAHQGSSDLRAERAIYKKYQNPLEKKLGIPLQQSP